MSKEWERLLRESKVQPDTAMKSAIIARASERLGQNAGMTTMRYAPERKTGGWLGGMKPVYVLAVVLMISVMTYLQFTGFMPKTNHDASAMKILAEYRQLFGNQLQGVIRKNGGTELILSSMPQTVTQQPVVIRIQNGTTTEIISFAGQQLTIPVNGKEIVVDVLTTTQGEPFLAGDDFIWKGGKQQGMPDHRIEAKLLEM